MILAIHFKHYVDSLIKLLSIFYFGSSHIFKYFQNVTCVCFTYLLFFSWYIKYWFLCRRLRGKVLHEKVVIRSWEEAVISPLLMRHLPKITGKYSFHSFCLYSVSCWFEAHNIHWTCLLHSQIHRMTLIQCNILSIPYALCNSRFRKGRENQMNA